MKPNYKNIANVLLSKIWEDFTCRNSNISSLWTKNGVDMWQFLFEKGLHEIKDHEDSFFALAAGIECNNLTLVSFLTEKGVNLHFEIKGDYSDKDNPHVRKETQKTPGMLAIEKGDLKLIKHLISVENIVNWESSEGETMFSWAVKYDKYEIAKYLIEVGAIVKGYHHGIGENCPIHNAVRNRNYDMVKLLIENGADVNVVNERKESIFHIAFDCSGQPKEKFEMIKFLANLNVNPNLKAIYEHKQYTPFEVAKDWERDIMGEFSKKEYHEISDFLKDYEKEYNNKVVLI